MNFTDKLKKAIESSGSVLSVGLDPDPARLPLSLKEQVSDPNGQVVEFCRRVINATKQHACAFKPNMAFFEAMGDAGWQILEEVSDMIPSNRIFIADAKRGDIGNTAGKYREAFFDRLNADAVTLNPLMGLDTLEPYFGDASKALFILTMTSNTGAADFLQRRFEGRLSLGEYIAELLSKKQERSETHLGMVVGATQPEAFEPVIKAHSKAHLLIPGIGTQGGTVESVVKATADHKGMVVVNASRSVIYAGSGSPEWEQEVSLRAEQLKEKLKPITERYVA
ncbi:MAG: orotidine-5'-phosphate decarboxylase [Balneolaceae bacterium]|nr:MAG: orotidine-5'-phosphate decarboxylase [Balneolaceae bacterium]